METFETLFHHHLRQYIPQQQQQFQQLQQPKEGQLMNQNHTQQQHNMYSRQVTIDLRHFQSQQQRQLQQLQCPNDDDCGGPSITTGSDQDDNNLISSDGIVAGSEWKLIVSIGEGSFGQIFQAESVRTGEVSRN
jgi:exonuclease VII large subunit